MQVRKIPGLVERRPGIFYRRSQAFLHFHEDVSGLYADVKLHGRAFERFCVTSADQRHLFENTVRRMCEAAVDQEERR